MERSRAALFICVLVSRISGEEVEMRVGAGDDVTIYSDCVWKTGFYPVWFRNSPHQRKPALMISQRDIIYSSVPQYSFVWNTSSQAHDLLVKNLTVSELGLYYCGLQEKKLAEDENGAVVKTDVYHYGKKTTKLHLHDSTVQTFSTSASTPVIDCIECWKLLFSVVPVSVLLSSLLSSTCVYCICTRRTRGSKERRELLTENMFQVGCVEEHQCEKTMNGQSCDHTVVCYTSLRSDLKSD